MSASVATSSESSQCRDIVVSQRPDVGIGPHELIAVHHPVAASPHHAHVLPAHSAETLARALIAIPIHARVHGLSSSDSALSHAAAFVTDTASALRRSTAVGTQIIITLRNIWSDISKLGGEEPLTAHSTMPAMRKQASAVHVHIREVRNALNALCLRAPKISHEVDKEIGRVLAAETQKRHWKTAVRVGSIGLSLPSFATAAVSAVYNTTSPRISLILALISAGFSTCAAVGPYIAQSYWECGERGPQLATLQSVHIEAVRMQYPLGLVRQWWRKLDLMFRGLLAASEPDVAKRIYEPMVAQLSKYTEEMQGILSSTMYHDEAGAVVPGHLNSEENSV